MTDQASDAAIDPELRKILPPAGLSRRRTPLPSVVGLPCAPFPPLI
jgi:hypothetical protein